MGIPQLQDYRLSVEAHELAHFTVSIAQWLLIVYFLSTPQIYLFTGRETAKTVRRGRACMGVPLLHDYNRNVQVT